MCLQNDFALNLAFLMNLYKLNMHHSLFFKIKNFILILCKDK